MYRHGLGTHAKHLGGLDEPRMYRHGLGTRKTERSNMSRIEDTINMRCSPLMTSPSHVMIGHGLVDSDHVSLR